MKKLLSILTLCCGVAGYAGAQTTIMSQNFETSKTAIPAGWHQQVAASIPTNLGFQFGNAVLPASGNLATYYMAGSGSYFTFVNDMDNNTGNSLNTDTLYSSVMNCSTYAHVIVSFDEWFGGFYYTSPADTEQATLAVSNDGGVTWKTAGRLPYYQWSNASFDISSMAGGKASVMLAFTYNDMGLDMGGLGLDNILVVSPLNYDLSVTSQNLPYLMQVGNAYTFTGTIYNNGGDSIVSMHLNYTVNGGPVQTDNITSIAGFNALSTYNFSHSITFTPPSAGNYKVKIWADNLNGANVDQNHANDTLVANFMAIGAVQARTAVYEDVVGQSCYYCMLSAPNVDSVYMNNTKNVNILHYHVPYPTTPDYMYSVNTALGSAMISYYSVSGTPTGELDGQTLYPGTLAAPQDLSTPNIAQENAIGSPFTINITSCTYNTGTKVYSLNATITSYATFAAGLSAKVALTVDSIMYTADYSADDPTSSFQPPIGTTAAASGGTPDYLYKYTETFSSVVEDMLPSTSGTTLAAFTPASTQTLTLSWTKNHPWSQNGKTYPYDSSATTHMTVFIQTNSAMPASGVPAKYVFQSASSLVTTVLGFEEISNGVYFEMYPNPTSSNTTLNFKLDKSTQVNVDVYDMLGQKVIASNNGTMSAGEHAMNIDCTGLQSGVYFVKIATDNGTVTKRLVVQQ